MSTILSPFGTFLSFNICLSIVSEPDNMLLPVNMLMGHLSDMKVCTVVLKQIQHTYESIAMFIVVLVLWGEGFCDSAHHSIQIHKHTVPALLRVVMKL